VIVTPGQLSRRAELYHQLGSMISAGVPLIQALEMVTRNPSIHVARPTILALIEHLKTGLTFSESMVKIQGWMPEFDVALLSVGEESGRLDESFKTLATYYATRAQIIRDTIAGLLVTLASLHVFLLVFPIGLLQECARGFFYNDYARCVPFLVEKLVVFGAGYGLTLFFIFACQGQRGQTWRAVRESVFSIVPILCTALKFLTLSRLAAAMEALTSAGVPVTKAWQLAAAAAGSPRLRREVSEWSPLLESGLTPAELIGRTRYFPEMFANLYTTGEVSGKGDETLGRLRDYYQEEGFRKLRLFTRVLNGILYGLIVLLIAYNVFSFYAGYYNNIFQTIGG
jgi:type II secretory pathway component PulF